MPVVVGIDLAAGRGITEVAALLVAEESRIPVFDASTYQRVTTDEEIVDVVSSAQPAVLAIDAPLSLPRAVLRGLTPRPAPEHLPSSEAPVPLTSNSSPYTRAAERDALWTALGIRPLPVSFLGGLAFRAISLLPKLRAVAPQTAIIEVFPSATLRCLGITSPPAGGTTARGRIVKTSEPARQATQRGLYALIQGIPQPDKELLGADLLDALAAALTGVAYMRGEFMLVGDRAEGGIVLPAWRA